LDENMTGKAAVSSLAGPASDLPTLGAAQAADPASSSKVNYSPTYHHDEMIEKPLDSARFGGFGHLALSSPKRRGSVRGRTVRSYNFFYDLIYDELFSFIPHARCLPARA
jgi:hypothetical protein